MAKEPYGETAGGSISAAETHSGHGVCRNSTTRTAVDAQTVRRDAHAEPDKTRADGGRRQVLQPRNAAQLMVRCYTFVQKMDRSPTVASSVASPSLKLHTEGQFGTIRPTDAVITGPVASPCKCRRRSRTHTGCVSDHSSSSGAAWSPRLSKTRQPRNRLHLRQRTAHEDEGGESGTWLKSGYW